MADSPTLDTPEDGPPANRKGNGKGGAGKMADSPTLDTPEDGPPARGWATRQQQRRRASGLKT